MNEYIKRETVGKIGVLTLTRTEAMNALNTDMVMQLTKAAGRAVSDGVRVLIFTGEGNFAAGADVAAMAELTPEEAAGFQFGDAYREIEELEIPTIAAIRGYALGGGLELALACDFRLASGNAVMGLPEIDLGIMPGAGGTVRLPRLVGEAKAKELIYLGKKLNAEEALWCGLVHGVYRDEELMDSVWKLAEKLSIKSASALAAAKKSVMSCGREAAFEEESKIWTGLFSTRDQREGMKAFIEKRRPDFTGA